MRALRGRDCYVWPVVVAVVAMVGIAAAQEEKKPLLGDLPAEQVGERASELLASVQEATEAIQRYRAMLAEASAEDSLVVRLQVIAQQDRGMADIHELADVLAELEKRGEQPELRERMETAFRDIAPKIWELIGDLRGEIDGLRAVRQAASPTERLDLQDTIARITRRLDEIFEIGWRHVQKLEAMGRDATEERAELVALLEARSDELSGRLKLDLERIDRLNARLAESPDDADVVARLTTARKSLENNTASQETVLDLMDAVESATEDYRAELVTATRDFSSSILDAKVTVSLVSRAWAGFTEWLASEGPRFLVKLLLFLAIIFAGRILARVVRRAVEHSLEHGKLNLSQLLRRMIVTSAYNAVVILSVLIALSQLGISLGPLLAGFGVVGFILGFAMQDSLSNLAAGMMILLYRPYDVGDVVELSGVFGKVENMSLVSTSILTLDNQKLMVPNSKIWGDVIKNVTDQKIRRVDMVFGISYSDDIPLAEKVLMEILQQHEKVLDEPEPVVKLYNLGESSVDFVVRPWVATADYWEVFWDVTRAVKMRFDEESISIPFPQRDVHIYEQKLMDRTQPDTSTEVA